MKMNFIKSILIISALYPLTSNGQDSGDKIFSGVQVHTIKIKFSQPSYWDSLTTYYTQGNEQYMSASITLDGEQLDSVGVRLKGNASYSHPNNKKSMRLSFDEYRSDQRWDGLKGVHLNNCWGDPSFLREKIHLDFCRDAVIVAPRSNYAMVYINDEVWGLYSLVEHVDKKFLSSRFGNKNGNLYKAVDAFGGQPGGVPGQQTTQILSDFVWYGSTSSAYTSHYEFKTDESKNPWADLISVINVLNNSQTIQYTLAEKVNLVNFYKAISADILFANMDSYTDSGRNFYLYFNSDTGKMEWIVWDVSLTFGAYPGQGNTTSAEQINLTYTSNSSSRPLIGKVFNNSELKNNYLLEFYKIFKTYFVPAKMFAHIDSITTVIRPYVSLDIKKQYTLAQFESNILTDITSTQGGGAPPGPGGGGPGGNNRTPGIKSFIIARQANVQTQFDRLNISVSDIDDKNSSIPTDNYLCQNYPNPFNPTTTIKFQIPESGYVSLKVYDVLGRELITLVDEYKSAGSYTIKFDAALISTGKASGVYFYKLTTPKFSSTKKMLLIK